MESMKRTFGVVAMMAFFTFPAEADRQSPSKNQDLKDLRMHYISAWVEDVAAEVKLEPALLRAIIRVESNFNHKAVSRVGARGLMQLMPSTALELREARAVSARDPRSNIRAGARYLRQMINRFDGDLNMALAAYNAGPAAVDRHGGVPPYRETRAYVGKVMAALDLERTRQH